MKSVRAFSKSTRRDAGDVDGTFEYNQATSAEFRKYLLILLLLFLCDKNEGLY